MPTDPSCPNERALKPESYVPGDLVYYTGYEHAPKSRKVGVVVSLFDTGGHFAHYKVFWLNDGIMSAHVANHLELVYNEKT